MGCWNSTDLVSLDWSSMTAISVLRILDKCEEWKKFSGRTFYSGKQEETGPHAGECFLRFWFCLFWSFWVQFVLLKPKHYLKHYLKGNSVIYSFTHCTPNLYDFSSVEHKRSCFEKLYNGSQLAFIVRPKSKCWHNFYFWVNFSLITERAIKCWTILDLSKPLLIWSWADLFPNDFCCNGLCEVCEAQRCEV